MKQVPNPNVDLELDELDLEECIGRGGHGAVYKVRLLCGAWGGLASAQHPPLCRMWLSTLYRQQGMMMRTRSWWRSIHTHALLTPK